MAGSRHSFAQQGAHDFDRPHEGLPPGPITGRARERLWLSL